MARITITPEHCDNLYGLLTKKELELRRNNQGTLHRCAAKERGKEKWGHSSYPGWIRFQRCIGNVVVAQVQSRNSAGEWQLLSSFIGFLYRHFRKHIANVSIVFDEEK